VELLGEEEKERERARFWGVAEWWRIRIGGRAGEEGRWRDGEEGSTGEVGGGRGERRDEMGWGEAEGTTLVVIRFDSCGFAGRKEKKETEEA
jgi:hypothetical protein